MNVLLRTGGLALVAWLAIGCACDGGADDGGVRTLQATDLALLAPREPVDKAVGADEIDFEFVVQPDRSLNHNRPGYKVKVERGDAPFEATITGDWLGDNTPGCFGIDFGPEGFEWASPIEMAIKIPWWVLIEYDPACLMIVLDNEDGTYEPVPSRWEFRQGFYWLDGEIEHFSKYLVAVGPPPELNR